MESSRRGWIIVIGGTVIVVLGILLWLCWIGWIKHRPPVVGSEGGGPLAACGSGPMFSVAPLEDGQYAGLVPLGALNPPAHSFPTDHHYFYLTIPGGSAAPAIVPVRIPGDVHVTEIASSENRSASPPYTDYKMYFKPCVDYEAYFGHLSTLSNDLQTQINTISPNNCQDYSTGGENFRYCQYSLDYPVSAGTVIGTTGGRAGQWALDFGAHDSRQPPLQWVNQARIQAHAPQMPFTACPSEVFTPAIKAALGARFSNYDGTVHRTVPPVCGRIDQDVAATAQGLWFRDGVSTVYPEDPHLALVHDNVDPTEGVISVGTSIAASGRHTFTPAHTGFINREFSEVTNDGNVYCYTASGSGSLLIQLMPDALGRDWKLTVEHRPSANCAATPYAFTTAKVVFLR